MLGLYSFLFPWNFILVAIAIVHFIRRRPETYWLYVILIGGSLGAIIYIFVEVLPDLETLPRPVSIMYPNRQHLAPQVRTFIDWATGIFAKVGTI